MSVTLLRPYQTFLSGAVVTLPSATETALIAQGLATAAGITSEPSIYGGPDQFVTQGGNVASVPNAGFTTPTYYQGPLVCPNAALGVVALTALGASSAHVAGTMNLSEIYVPYLQTWTGIGVLNGTTTVGTDNMLVALYGSDGTLLANSAVAGTLSATVSVFQNRAFTAPITLIPGRYFLGVQSNGTTATTNKFVVANGANVMTSAVAGTFGTVPATVTPPATFTTAVGCVAQLYV